jgi:hypothetical protein
MAELTRDRWIKARAAVIGRWRQVLERVESCDEVGVLATANTLDEFCEEAMLGREAASAGSHSGSGPVLKISTSGEPIGSRCLFCRGFIDSGGCFGMLDELNQAVLHGRWADARRVAQLYIDRLQSLPLT